MSVYYQVHVVLFEVDENGDTEVLGEEEVKGYPNDFTEFELARKVFVGVTGKEPQP